MPPDSSPVLYTTFLCPDVLSVCSSCPASISHSEIASKESMTQKTPHKIRKAVFPAAGLGTRFLPATKAIPKEMLCLVDKPLIQYGVEEAVAAGCTEIIIVTGRGKSTMEDHVDKSPELEATLEARNKKALLEVA